MALILRQHVLFPVQHLTAPGAANLEQLAVHMDDVPVTGPLVKVVDILRYQQKTIAQRLFQLRQRQMRRIRRDVRLLKLTTAGVVKRLHEIRVAGKAFRRGDILHAVLFPQPVRRAEGSNS